MSYVSVTLAASSVNGSQGLLDEPTDRLGTAAVAAPSGGTR